VRLWFFAAQFTDHRLPCAARRVWFEPCGDGGSLKDKGVRLLVVEDDKKTAAFISKALKEEGFAVDVLRDGDAALAAVET
jgi:PleD family two-component response regulator